MEVSEDEVTFERAEGAVEIPDNKVTFGGYVLSFREDVPNAESVTVNTDERTFVFEDVSKPLWCDSNELHAGELQVR